MQSVNEVQVNVISDESRQWVLGNVVVNETSGVECPLVTLKGTPPGDRYKCNAYYHNSTAPASAFHKFIRT